MVLILLFQVSIAMLMVVVGTVDQLIDGFTFISFVFYGMVIAAVIILRITHRKEPRLFAVRMFTCETECEQ